MQETQATIDFPMAPQSPRILVKSFAVRQKLLTFGRGECTTGGDQALNPGLGLSPGACSEVVHSWLSRCHSKCTIITGFTSYCHNTKTYFSFQKGRCRVTETNHSFWIGILDNQQLFEEYSYPVTFEIEKVIGFSLLAKNKPSFSPLLQFPSTFQEVP
jgi:hypothetical protein